MSEHKFKKGDQEYINNGHYKIEGEEFMSVWTFKNAHGITPNSNSANGADGADLRSRFGGYESKPDFGNFDMVYLFSVKELKSFYSIQD